MDGNDGGKFSYNNNILFILKMRHCRRHSCIRGQAARVTECMCGYVGNN